MRELKQAISDFRKALNALLLEVDATIAQDLSVRFDKVVQSMDTRPDRDELFNLLKRFAEYEFDFGNNSHQAGDYAKHFTESDAFKSVMNIDNNVVPKSDNSVSPTTEQIVEAVMKVMENVICVANTRDGFEVREHILTEKLTNAINNLKQNL